MTDDLQTLLSERASSATLAAPDIDAITRVGRGRVRRRRGLTALGVLAALAVIGAGVSVVAPRLTDDQSASTVRSGRISWAEGQVIHEGDRTIDVGRLIVTYVRTSVGFVFVDDEAEVWSVHDGKVDEVGVTSPADPHLVADPDGVRAGWVDPTGPRFTFVELDQATGEVLRTGGYTSTKGPQLLGNLDARMIAIDGRSAYWRDGDQTVETSHTDDGETAQGTLAPGVTVLTALDDRAVLRDEATGTLEVGYVNGPYVELPQVDADAAALSPDHLYVSLFADAFPTFQPAVFDTRTGSPIDLDLGATMALGYEWLDDETLALLAVPHEGSDYQLLTCEVPSGECAIAVDDLGEGPDSGGGNGVRFVLPTGDLFFPYPHG